MKKRNTVRFDLLMCLLIISNLTSAQMNPKPKATKIPHTLTTHNHQRVDNYFWMRDRDSKEVLDYLAAENNFSKDYFAPLSPLVDSLMIEFDHRINPNEISAPFILNKKTYQVKNKAGLDYQQIFEVKGVFSHLFFDENQRAQGHSFYELSDWAPSPDNSILAVCEDFVGRRKYDVHFREEKNGNYLKDVIKGTSGHIVWGNDNKTIFYIKKDPTTLREYQVYRHVLGTDSKKDVLIYEELDDKFSVDIEKSLTQKFIFINTYSSTCNEVLYIDASAPETKPTVFINRSEGHLYEIGDHLEGFYILSNSNAPNKRVLFASQIPHHISDCKEYIPNHSEVMIESITVFNNQIVLEQRENGLLKLKIKTISTGAESYIDFKEETYYVGLGLNDDYNADFLFYSYNSLTTPSSIFQYNFNAGNSKIWYQKQLLDPLFSSDNYESKRIWAQANDGTKIPISIVYKKGTDLSTAPCLLYGYGSYGYTYPDVFSATRLSLLDRGFVYAIAHIRGSKYMGEAWYENGKFLKKINTFTDFINAAEYMGQMGYCDQDKIFAQGGSAGGLLMGAISNMAPYLWKGVVSQVPFVDVLTTMLDESIPLTSVEWEEWGNPNNPDFYTYLLHYSPYDNIKKMPYPAMYITTGYHDSQVQYWEPMKYVAKLRELKTDDQPLVFECNMEAGHGGGSGRTSERLEIAKVYAFILDLEGITQ